MMAFILCTNVAAIHAFARSQAAKGFIPCDALFILNLYSLLNGKSLRRQLTKCYNSVIRHILHINLHDYMDLSTQVGIGC